MNRRAATALGVLLLWLAGLGLLMRRELFRGEGDRLAERALLLSPGAAYFVVAQHGRQIGFASTTVDTTNAPSAVRQRGSGGGPGITITDVLLADLVADSALHRTTAYVEARMTRTLRLEGFRLTLGGELGPLNVVGMVEGDTLLRTVVSTDGTRADTQQVAIERGTILPTAVPLALTLGRTPEVGRSYQFAVFDPMTLAPDTVSVTVRAESTFVVVDSARFDEAARRWLAAHRDTVRGWRMEPDGHTMLPAGWVDEHGRLIEATQFGVFTLKRTAYEIAYNNWTIGRSRSPMVASGEADVLEATAIEASAPIRRKRALARLRVRLRDAELGGYALGGGRQRLRGDTLEVRRESVDELRAAYSLGAPPAALRAYLAPEPLIQADNREIRDTARAIVGGERDPAAAAELIARWVHRALDKKVTFGVPNALRALRTRRGDCNEHTALFIALARAAGLPARSTAGLAYVGGKFYYHAWPEVYLGGWTAVDPTFGQFPADAAHLRFVLGGYAREAELLRLVGALAIDVLETETASP